MGKSLSLNIEGEKCSARFATWTKTQKTILQWNEFDYRVRNRFELAIQAKCDHGTVPTSQARKIRNADDIWEFKADVQRVCWRAAAFKLRDVWYITHFFKTDHGNRLVMAEAKKAEMVRKEHLKAWQQ